MWNINLSNAWWLNHNFLIILKKIIFQWNSYKKTNISFLHLYRSDIGDSDILEVSQKFPDRIYFHTVSIGLLTSTWAGVELPVRVKESGTLRSATFPGGTSLAKEVLADALFSQDWSGDGEGFVIRVGGRFESSSQTRKCF